MAYAKNIANHYYQLNIQKLKLYRVLKNGGHTKLIWGNGRLRAEIIAHMENKSGGWLDMDYIILTETGESQFFRIQITLYNSQCNFGGCRFWFSCPRKTLQGFCKTKVVKLYFDPKNKQFGCRRCLNLTYEPYPKPLDPLHEYLGRLLEMEKLQKQIKRKIYAGKSTKNYRKFLEAENKFIKIAFSEELYNIIK